MFVHCSSACASALTDVVVVVVVIVIVVVVVVTAAAATVVVVVVVFVVVVVIVLRCSRARDCRSSRKLAWNACACADFLGESSSKRTCSSEMSEHITLGMSRDLRQLEPELLAT